MKFQMLFLVLLIVGISQQSLVAQDPYPCGADWMPPAIKRLVRQEFQGADFREGCRIHDRCYELPNANRLTCDNAFRDRLNEACLSSANPARCQRKVKKMYRAVRLFGEGTFRTWQAKVN